MVKYCFLPLIVLLSGCLAMGDGTSNPEYVYDINPKWLPLEDIRQRPRLASWAGASETAITTIGRSAYVADLNDWLAGHIPDGPEFDAKMAHEQAHSVRQLDMGTFLFVARYSYDTDFMWEEEQIGYYYEIHELRRRGRQVNPDAFAIMLSKYKNLAGSMVSFPEARQWVSDVLGNRWHPPE